MVGRLRRNRLRKEVDRKGLRTAQQVALSRASEGIEGRGGDSPKRWIGGAAFLLHLLYFDFRERVRVLSVFQWLMQYELSSWMRWYEIVSLSMHYHSTALYRTTARKAEETIPTMKRYE